LNNFDSLPIAGVTLFELTGKSFFPLENGGKLDFGSAFQFVGDKFFPFGLENKKN
jgi:hypothetical protein